MALWRKYIVLRTASRVEPRGHVKITADGSTAQIIAKVSFVGDLWLTLTADGQKRSVALKNTTSGAEYSGKIDIHAAGRILAAVHNKDGKLLAAGESDPPAASWSEFSRIIEKPKPEPRLSRPDFSDFGKKLVMTQLDSEKTSENAQTAGSAEVLDIKPVLEAESQTISEEQKTVLEHTEQTVREEIAQSEPELAEVKPSEPAVQQTEKATVETADIPNLQEQQVFSQNRANRARQKLFTVVDETSERPSYTASREHSGEAPKAKHEEQVQGPRIKETLGKWKWKKVVYRAGQGFYYLTGSVERNGELLAVAVAVPGEYSKTPPPNLRGFCGYADGYWVLAQNAKTGAKLEI